MPSPREAMLRHARYYLEVTRTNKVDFSALDLELPNIIQGMDTCIKLSNWELLAEFIRTLSDYLLKQGLWTIYKQYAYPLLQANILHKYDEKTKLLHRLAIVEESQGNYQKACQLYQQHVQTLDQTGAKVTEAYITALRQVARISILQEDYEKARLSLEQGLDAVRSQGDLKEQVSILIELAELHKKTNDLNQASSLFQQGLEIASRLGYTIGVIDILRQQASIQHAQQSLKVAQDLYQKALKLAVGTRDQTRANEIRKQLAKLQKLMGKGIFISYNQHDRDFVDRLAQDLKNLGFPVWWDEWEIKVGDSITQKVSEGINKSAYLALVLSPFSVQSHWVQREVSSALMKQLSAERNITILPLLVADCEIPFLLLETKWADFRHDYHTGLQKLLHTFLEEKDEI